MRIFLVPALSMRRTDLIALAFCLLTFGMGLAFLPIPGLHYDEILFLHPFLNDWALYRQRWFGQEYPLMVMSYVGALKTWLAWPLYTWLAPSAWVVRLPTLLLGCLNVWLLYRLGAKLWHRRAGLLAAALAATDPTFLLTHVFDWGPVAIQITLSLTAALTFLRWREYGSTLWLAVCGYCCGLALWNKAIFIWVLAAIALSAVICYPRQLIALVTPSELRHRGQAYILAGLCFLLGAAPILMYNIGRSGETLSSNATFERSIPAGKLGAAETSLDGSVIASYMFAFEHNGDSCSVAPQISNDQKVRFPAELEIFPRATLNEWAFIAAILVFIATWKSQTSRSGRFVVLTLALSYMAAIVSVGAGYGIHHYAPALPAAFLAVGGAWWIVSDAMQRLAHPSQRSISMLWIALAVLLPLYALWSMEGWRQRAEFCGGKYIWTNTTKELASTVRAQHGYKFYATDWGIDPQINYLSEKTNRMDFLGALNEEVRSNGPEFEAVERLLSDPNTRLVAFHDPMFAIEDHRKRLSELLTVHGYEAREDQVVHDSKGRPIFSIARLAKQENRLP